MKASTDKKRPRKSLLAGDGDIEQLRRAYSGWSDVQRVFVAFDEARARIAVLEKALSEVSRVLNAEHTAISGIDAIGLASVNAILHRLGRICDDALAPATPETGDGQ